MRLDFVKSLRRLGTEYIDLYQLHVWGYDIAKPKQVREELEALLSEGKIRFRGWSSDRIASVEDFTQRATAVRSSSS